MIGSRSGREFALRLGSGAAIVLVAFLALWRAGALDGDGAGVPADVASQLAPADAAIETPHDGRLQVGLRPGELAPNFEFSTFEGERLRLSDFRGRPAVVNFWASWCGPCRAEMPELEAALRRYDYRGLAVIGVNNGESFRSATRFLEDVQVTLTAHAYDPAQGIVRRYAVQGMPTTYFIDAEGVITRVVAGALTRQGIETAVEEAIIGWGRVRAR